MLKGELFSTDMVRAYLKNRKLHTCRPIKPQPPVDIPENHNICCMPWATARKGNPCDVWYMDVLNPTHMRYWEAIAPYRPGDFMYCRETFRPIVGVRDDYEFGEIVNTDEHEGFEYKAGGRYWPDGFEEINDEFHVTHILDGTEIGKSVWMPSIHMPRSAARLFFRVTKVEVVDIDTIDEQFSRDDGFNTLLDLWKFWRRVYGPSSRWMWVYWTEPVSKEEALADV